MKYLAHIIVILMLAGCSVQEEASDCTNIPKTIGLIKNTADSFNGYTLFSPSLSHNAYLIDNDGNIVNQWKSEYLASSVYLLPNGHLLRNAVFGKLGGHVFGRHGSIRQIEEYDWEGNLVWKYELSNDKFQIHHDIARLPNGNILAIMWERQTKEQAIASGRNPALLIRSENHELWPDAIIEIKPDYDAGQGGTIVWEWHLKDHLLQDFDPTKSNYFGPHGVKEHPERVNINYVSTEGGANPKRSDWTHFNAIDYNPRTDQIMVSAREFSELWIINHNISREEAAGPKGDLLYRFGNPQTYDQGDASDQQLFYQHDAQWIKEDLPGAGNILVFNNGLIRESHRNFSTVMEISPNIGKYGKADILWNYMGSPKESFYSPVISGAQRLPNGNTLIDEGTTGRYFEVTPKGKIVWQYINPDSKQEILTQGQKPPREYFMPVPNMYSNLTFRATRYAPTYPAFSGKTLTPQGPIEKSACNDGEVS